MGREVADFRRRRNSEEEPVETVALKNAWSYAREPPGEGEGNTETTGGAQRRRGGRREGGAERGSRRPGAGDGRPGQSLSAARLEASGPDAPTGGSDGQLR